MTPTSLIELWAAVDRNPACARMHIRDILTLREYLTMEFNEKKVIPSALLVSLNDGLQNRFGLHEKRFLLLSSLGEIKFLSKINGTDIQRLVDLSVQKGDYFLDRSFSAGKLRK